MATIIVRTNPDKFHSGWKCSQCHKPYVDFAKAKACAEKEYKRRTGRNPKKRVAA
jgi:transposase-like protein